MEDYKKKYEQALDNFKKIKAANKDNNELVDFIEYEYPELKESEEEKVRKNLREFLLDAPSQDIVSHHLDLEETLNWLEKQGEQKLTWSKEDSCYYDDICEILINLINSPKSNVNKDVVQKDLDWLRSVKKSQLKSTWSEEDELKMDTLIHIINNQKGSAIFEGLLPEELVNWLKSLKERYTWKPSEGQLECLGYAIEKAEKDWSPLINNRVYLTLKALKEQLEKL